MSRFYYKRPTNMGLSIKILNNYFEKVIQNNEENTEKH